MDIENKPKTSCTHILKSGKNKGYACNKYDCKKHTGTICNYILKNENLCGRFNCKRHGNSCDEIVYMQEDIKVEILTNKDEIDICQICLDDFSETKLMIKTHCNHIFHVKCIQRWCKKNPTCPLCRAEIGSFY